MGPGVSKDEKKKVNKKCRERWNKVGYTNDRDQEWRIVSIFYNVDNKD